jgi:cytochrome P450
LLLGKGLMVSEGDFWVAQRRMVQPAFHRAMIGTLSSIILECNRSLLAEWEQAARQRSSVNVTRDLSRMVLQIILRAIFSEDYDQCAHQFSILSEQPERSLEFADAFRPLADVVVRVAKQRRDANRSVTDILGMLMQARDRDSGQSMSDRQLSREVMTLVVAGHETTASVLNWTWYLLSQNPEAEQKLDCELDELLGSDFPTLDALGQFVYAGRIIEETMRLYPPGWLMTRKALEDDQLGEYHVPAGTEIYIAPFLIHRHPALWDQPDRFDPDRFSAERSQGRHALAMLPFSAGPRNCIGEYLARMEMQIHLVLISSRLRLCYVTDRPPPLAAGVNLLSGHDFVMTPELKLH